MQAVVPAKANRDRAYFIVLVGESVGAMFRVEAPEMLIGRTSNTLRAVSSRTMVGFFKPSIK